MLGLDTNILIRLAVVDDPLQHAAAKNLMMTSRETGFYLSAITIAETIWTLKRAYGYRLDTIARFLDALLRVDGISFEFETALGKLLEMGADPNMIADHFVALSGQRAGCSVTLTFDKRAAASVTGMELLT